MTDHAFLFFAGCGCPRGIYTDHADNIADIGEATRHYLRDGGRVERVLTEDFRAGKHGNLTSPGRCPHKPRTPSLFAKEAPNP